MATIGIVGGGISGLAVAHYLSKFSSKKIKQIVLFEATNRLGGWIQTTRLGDGSLFESGPRSVRPVGPAAQTTLSLVEDVGLSDQVISIARSHPAAKNRLIYANGRLNLLPSRLPDLFKIKSPLTERLISKLAAEIWIPKTNQVDESVYDFFRRRFGEEVAKYYVDAMCLGIFAGDSKKLSIRSCFKELWNMERSHGSVVRGALSGFGKRRNVSPSPLQSNLAKKASTEKWAAWSLRSGLEDLPKAIEENLLRDPRIIFRKKHTVYRIEPNPTSNVVVLSVGEYAESFDHLVSSIYAGNLAKLLPTMSDRIRDSLKSVPAVDVAVLNAQFKGSAVPMPAFGYLVPSCEDSKVLGVIFDSCLFTEHNGNCENTSTTRLTCMMGGAHFEKHFGDAQTADQQKLTEAALKTLGEHLQIHSDPTEIRVNVHKKCIPQYHVGHHHRIESIRNEVKDRQLPLSLIGSSYDGVSINDCIEAARLCAVNIGKSL